MLGRKTDLCRDEEHQLRSKECGGPGRRFYRVDQQGVHKPHRNFGRRRQDLRHGEIKPNESSSPVKFDKEGEFTVPLQNPWQDYERDRGREAVGGQLINQRLPSLCRYTKEEVTRMKVLEAIAAAIAAEGIDHLFAVMGDANQDIIVEL